MKRNPTAIFPAILYILFRALIFCVGAVPAFYLVIGGFDFFLVGPVFSGNLPPLVDAAGFLMFFGISIQLFALTVMILVGIILRILPPGPAFDRLRTETEMIARVCAVPLLPASVGKSLFRCLSGKTSR